MTPAIVGLTTLSVAQAIGNVAAFNPSLLDVQTYDDNHAGGDVRKSVRMGMVLGGAVSLAVGLGASIATKSKWPLVGTLGGLLIIALAYEWALRHQADA